MEDFKTAEGQHQFEEQARHDQRMEAVGRLAAGIAHDFNNHLTVILLLVEMLVCDLSHESPQHKLALDIRAATERAAALTNQLLRFSRRQQIAPRVIDLNALLTDTLGLLRRVIAENIEFGTRFASSLPRIQIDPGQMEQVIVNLAVNARDAMPAGGKLTFATDALEGDSLHAPANAPSGPCVVLSVRDTGLGMDEATRARIFEPFFTTKDTSQGTGLGLVMVEWIVRQHGGCLTVHSEVGRGSRFEVWLPAVAETAGPAAAGTELPAASSPTATIVLVEDDARLRQTARRILETAGHLVLEAAHGDEALEVCRQHASPIDLAICDVVLPGFRGRVLADRLKALRPDVKLLFISGHGDDIVAEQGIRDTEVAILHKPFSALSLTGKVREVLDQA